MAETFTPEQIAQILEAFFDTVGTRQYIGARYVPIFGRKDEESIEWDNSKPYEPLTIVLYLGNSYTSRQYVPAGVQITDAEFWAVTGNYNAQVEQYRRETARALQAAQSAQESADNAQNDIDTLLPKSKFSSENTIKDTIDAAQLSANNAQSDIDTLLPKSAFSSENTIANAIDASLSAAKSYYKENSNILIAHIMMRVLNNNDWKPKLCISKNGLDWTPVEGAFDTNTAYGEMSRPYFKDGYAYFVCRNAGVGNSLAYYVTQDFRNAEFKLISTNIPTYGVSTNWTPQIVEDANGNTYIISTVFTGQTFNTYEKNPTIGETIYADSSYYTNADESVCYITPVSINDGAITATGNSEKIDVSFSGVTDYCGIDYDILYWNGLYHLLYRDTRFQTICHATSTNINGPYIIADYDNLAIFKDVALEAPVMTVINNRVYVNYQTYGRTYGCNLLASTVDFAEWDFVGYPRRIDKNQFGFVGASSSGERPRNISPQILPAEFVTDDILKTVTIETGGFHAVDLGARQVLGEFFMPAYNAYHKLSNKNMSPCLPNTAFVWNHTGGYNETDIIQNNAMMIIPFYYGRFYAPNSMSMHVNNANMLIGWNLLGNTQVFGGAGQQELLINLGRADARICQTTIAYSVELESLIENNPVRAFINVPPNAGHIEIKIVRKSGTYTGETVTSGTNLFKVPIKINANKSIPYNTNPSAGEMRFYIDTNGYIKPSINITQALATGAWECAAILTQWQVSLNAI